MHRKQIKKLKIWNLSILSGSRWFWKLDPNDARSCAQFLFLRLYRLPTARRISRIHSWSKNHLFRWHIWYGQFIYSTHPSHLFIGTAVFTLLTPPFARMGYGMLVFARFMEGLLEGVTYPAMHVIWSRWAPPMEQTKLATFAFSGYQNEKFLENLEAFLFQIIFRNCCRHATVRVFGRTFWVANDILVFW